MSWLRKILAFWFLCNKPYLEHTSKRGKRIAKRGRGSAFVVLKIID